MLSCGLWCVSLSFSHGPAPLVMWVVAAAHLVLTSRAPKSPMPFYCALRCFLLSRYWPVQEPSPGFLLSQNARQRSRRRFSSSAMEA
ncbi:hypothetical protein LZ30DRAFT_705223 [Colletotrichum cereale]|nr:hypothetical protein LZ30DRAFT_705223 [Colletotrichum cereale]